MDFGAGKDWLPSSSTKEISLPVREAYPINIRYDLSQDDDLLLRYGKPIEGFNRSTFQSRGLLTHLEFTFTTFKALERKLKKYNQSNFNNDGNDLFKKIKHVLSEFKETNRYKQNINDSLIILPFSLSPIENNIIFKTKGDIKRYLIQDRIKYDYVSEFKKLRVLLGIMSLKTIMSLALKNIGDSFASFLKRDIYLKISPVINNTFCKV